MPDLCDCRGFVPLDDDDSWCWSCDHHEDAHAFGVNTSWCEYDYHPAEG